MTIATPRDHMRERALAQAKQARVTKILGALVRASDGVTFTRWVTQSGEAERMAYANAIEPLLAEAEARPPTQGSHTDMIRTDGTPTICSPEVDLAGLDALREDNVRFLKPGAGHDVLVRVSTADLEVLKSALFRHGASGPAADLQAVTRLVESVEHAA